MKKRTFLLASLLAVSVFIGCAAAAGGDAGDPLISFRYLFDTFSPQAEKQIDTAVEKAGNEVLSQAKAQWSSAVAQAEAAIGTEHSGTWTEAGLKQGDLLSGPTGLEVVPYAGTLTVSFSDGCVIDVTDGRELSSGSTLTANHRYLVAENTTASFAVSSKTAVLSYCGGYHFSFSSQPDYPKMADALKSLHLFRGTDTAYGSGYDLEQTPTRIQAIIMLIRLLGEEDAALRCTAPHPFVDVPEWCNAYVAYAYEKGYSNGVGRDRLGREIFGTQMDASAVMYTEFVLRALGYSSTAVADISDALERAQSAGILTDGERAQLKSTVFQRADVVYLSYYALSSRTSGGDSLSQRLMESGIFSQAEYRSAQSMVTSQRIS